MIDRDEYAVRLVDLPAGVGGFITESSDGFLNIYINARHSREGQRRSLRHELRHAEHDDLHSPDPLAVIEARADQKPFSLGKVARPVTGSDEVPARLASIPHLLRARDLLPPPCLPLQGKVAERSEVGRGRPLPSLTPRQLAVIRRALAELDRAFFQN